MRQTPAARSPLLNLDLDRYPVILNRLQPTAPLELVASLVELGQQRSVVTTHRPGQILAREQAIEAEQVRILRGCRDTPAGRRIVDEDIDPPGAQCRTEIVAQVGTMHGANTMADYDLMKSIWTEDAVFNGPGGPIVGPTAIANFFAAGPRWGKTASLAPTYKTQYAIQGNEAQLQFECILVDTGGKSPLATTLSTVPSAPAKAWQTNIG